jgi:hypothetical protein
MTMMLDRSQSVSAPVLWPRLLSYIDAIGRTPATDDGRPLISVIVFGSAAVGGWSEAVSDVDLILVMPDDSTQQDRRRLQDEVERLECLHGFRHGKVHSQRPLEMFMRKITANMRSFFICTRSDLLSGSVGRILGLPRSQEVFVDRAVLANVAASGITVHGEDLLSRIPLEAIRRFDVLKAFCALFTRVLLTIAVFPLVREATRFAMGSLKGSIHNCFFCYQLRRASLEEEIRFLQGSRAANGTFTQLLALRDQYRDSFAFVIRCLPALIRLHLRTALDNRFPREVVRGS